jgi:hypothetical protein
MKNSFRKLSLKNLDPESELRKLRNWEVVSSDFAVFDRRYPQQSRHRHGAFSGDLSSLTSAFEETFTAPSFARRTLRAPEGLFESVSLSFSQVVVDTVQTCGAYQLGGKFGRNIDCTGFFWRCVFNVLEPAKKSSSLTDEEITKAERTVVSNWNTYAIAKNASVFSNLNTKASLSDPKTVGKGDFVLMFNSNAGHIVVATEPYFFCHSGVSRGCESVPYRKTIPSYFSTHYPDQKKYSVHTIDWAKMFTFIYNIDVN